MDPLLVMVPTYNESGNVERLCREVLALDLAPDLLFVEDNSIDGTGAILDRLAAEFPRVHVLHRPGKLGVGSAHETGIRWAYANGYRRLVTMDCDFTHDPSQIPALLRAADEGAGADVVVGSRYLDPGSIADWNPYRKLLTRTGHLLTKALLGMPYDATNAFRFYRIDTIPCRAFELVVSKGYSFFFESLHVLHRNGFRIAEVPVPMPKRTYGHSKMEFAEIRRSVALLGATWFKVLFNPEKFQIGEEPEAVGPGDPAIRDEQGWDAYWDAGKTETGGLLYDAIAAFYRKWIIRPSLNRFAGKYFAPGAHVLHAGCGSGQVDVDLRERVAITGLDISVNALQLYRKVNGPQSRTLHGSVFRIPLPDGCVDGIYNLGVMEHFSEPEIGRILREFYRVLDKDGRVVVFWPPEFGLSVLFFKGLGWVFRNVLGRQDVKFHPDEITRVRSRRHVTHLFEREGFEVLDYAFGARDLFTYAVIVARRIDRPWRDGDLLDSPLGNGRAAQDVAHDDRLAQLPVTPRS